MSDPSGLTALTVETILDGFGEIIASPADVAYVSDEIRALVELSERTIDESTPVGQYLRSLERSVIELEDSVDGWRQRYAIAAAERDRAEARVGELERLLDVSRRAADRLGRVGRPRTQPLGQAKR